MKSAYFSIIIPVYNVEKYLHQCVKSVLNQTFEELEIILVDDGSPDGCPKICDEFAKKDPRAKVIHQANAGLSAARNAGLKVATGTYITFVDSDDYIAPDYISYLFSLITRHGTLMSICAISELTIKNHQINYTLFKQK